MALLNWQSFKSKIRKFKSAVQNSASQFDKQIHGR